MPKPFEKEKPDKGNEKDEGPPKGKGDGDDWKDGDDFGGGDEKGNGANFAEGGGAAGEGEDGPPDKGSIHGESESAEEEGKGQVTMSVEDHESGEGHRVHFHDDVNADLCGDADYQHHVTEYAKHMAGHLVNKNEDHDKAEAHRHAANLHARIGNALHAGGDTEPRRQQGKERAAELEELQNGLPGGLPGQEEDGSEFPTGFGSDDWQDGDDVAFPGLDEPSPGQDLAQQPQPSKPDMQRNAPSRDSLLEAKRTRSGAGSPKLTFGSAKKSHQVHTLKKAKVKIPFFYTW